VAGGYNAIIRDPSAEQRKAAIHFIDNNVAEFAKVLGVTVDKLGKYSAVEDLETAVANAWFVVEAVPEKLELKISIFNELSLKAPKDCILGSNSSSYKSSMMLERVDRESKARVLNVHYTMPPTTRTVELMTSTFTNEAIFPFLVEHHERIGLLPAVARKESTG
jgi:3-hydroxyacyl-CoA dehydrogenase